jgi:hypothetical protein
VLLEVLPLASLIRRCEALSLERQVSTHACSATEAVEGRDRRAVEDGYHGYLHTSMSAKARIGPVAASKSGHLR